MPFMFTFSKSVSYPKPIWYANHSMQVLFCDFFNIWEGGAIFHEVYD